MLSYSLAGVFDLKRVIGISLAALAAMAIVGCGSGGAKSTATVNGEAITAETLNEFMAIKNTVRVRDGNGQEVLANLSARLDFQLLQDVIQRQLVVQMAKDNGVMPSDGDIVQELEFRKRRNPNYIKQMNMAGIQFDTIKAMIAYELAEERLITQGVTVTMDETEKFIKENPQQFTDPATADMLYVLVTSDAKRATVDKALASGQSFSLVAAQYSDAPDAKTAGAKFANRNIATYPPNLQNAVTKAVAGKTTDWIQFPEGYAKFYVESKKDAKLRNLNDDEKKAVQRELMKARGRQATDIEKKLLAQLNDAKITISDAGLNEIWKQYIEEVKKRASSMGIGATTPTAGTTSGAPAPATTTGQ